MLRSSPKIAKAIKSERKSIASIIDTYHINGIISDNRLGAHSKDVPCVFITHQLQVLSGNTTWLSSKLHQKIIKRFDECWVPDNLGETNLSGKLGHIQLYDIPIKYIGPLSRFTKKTFPIKYDILVLISGPEPQRSIFEKQLLSEFKNFEGNIIFIKGIIEDEQQISEEKNITIYNYMTTSQLEHAINESALVVSRSGYTTLMDLAKLGKKAFFIPTPGQYEQEYLAKRLTQLGISASCKQEDFTLKKLDDAKNYKGLNAIDYEVNFKRLFGLFEGK